MEKNEYVNVLLLGTVSRTWLLFFRLQTFETFILIERHCYSVRANQQYQKYSLKLQIITRITEHVINISIRMYFLCFTVEFSFKTVC